MSTVPPMVVTIASEGRDVAEVSRRWLVAAGPGMSRWTTETAAMDEAAALRAAGETHVEVRVVVECIVTEIPPAPQPEEPAPEKEHPKVVDLMAALQESLDRAKERKSGAS